MKRTLDQRTLQHIWQPDLETISMLNANEELVLNITLWWIKVDQRVYIALQNHVIISYADI